MWRHRVEGSLNMNGPDPRRRARREVVAAIIGAEAGAVVGLLAAGATPGAPLAFAAAGAVVGSGVMAIRQVLIRRWLRSRLRGVR
jgi:hypothetical protein